MDLCCRSCYERAFAIAARSPRFVFALLLAIRTNLTADANALKLLISVETQTITAPFPARVTLHLHNAGRQPLWLYRKARDPVAIQREARHVALDSDEHPSAYAAGGSTATVRLEPADSRNVRTPAEGTVLESVGMPHPKLIRLAPGDDYDEKAVIRLVPAMAGTEASAKPVWGRYRLSVVYRAQFLNAEEIERNLGLVVWQGEVSSNTLDLDLRPPTRQGSVAGPALGADSRPIPGILVSLSDEQERPQGHRSRFPWQCVARRHRRRSALDGAPREFSDRYDGVSSR